MAARLFQAHNGPAPTTAAQVPVTTGTAIKTLLQIATPSTKGITVVQYAISFDGSAAATPIRVELIETDVAATVTAYAASGVIKLSHPDAEASLVTLGTAASGYTASAEGTITATRVLDVQFVPPTGSYIALWPLGREPVIPVSKFLRIRVTAAAAVNAYASVTWEE